MSRMEIEKCGPPNEHIKSISSTTLEGGIVKKSKVQKHHIPCWKGHRDDSVYKQPPNFFSAAFVTTIKARVAWC